MASHQPAQYAAALARKPTPPGQTDPAPEAGAARALLDGLDWSLRQARGLAEAGHGAAHGDINAAFDVAVHAGEVNGAQQIIDMGLGEAKVDVEGNACLLEPSAPWAMASPSACSRPLGWGSLRWRCRC